MRSIAIMNQKGGVGKTTTAVNLGAALARAGRRVGLIDLDPQAHASLHLGIDDAGDGPTMYEVFASDANLVGVAQVTGDAVTVFPAHIDLAGVEIELADVSGRESVLRRHLPEIENHFDYLLIDCPPSLGVLTLNALAAVGEVVLPLQPHFLALHGLSKLLGTIDLVAGRLNPRLRVAGVVLSMFESGTRLAGEVSRDAEAFFAASADRDKPWSDARVFQTRIRKNVRLAEAPSFGQSIIRYEPRSNGAADYQALAAEVVEMETASAGLASAAFVQPQAA